MFWPFDVLESRPVADLSVNSEGLLDCYAWKACLFCVWVLVALVLVAVYVFVV